jgi:hypothetical protein
MSIRPWDLTRKEEEEVSAFSGGSSSRRNLTRGHGAPGFRSNTFIVPAAVVR